MLQQLNDSLSAPPQYYRYESGDEHGMRGGSVIRMLALMEEFFQTRLNVTNSPALMKALLINGARSISDQYDLAVSNTSVPTAQGWGLPNLPNSIPPALANVNSGNLSTTLPFAAFLDQKPHQRARHRPGVSRATS